MTHKGRVEPNLPTHTYFYLCPDGHRFHQTVGHTNPLSNVICLCEPERRKEDKKAVYICGLEARLLPGEGDLTNRFKPRKEEDVDERLQGKPLLLQSIRRRQHRG